MSVALWIGIFGTLVGLGFVLSSVRNLRISPKGHVANAGRIHIATVAVFLPVMWLVIVLGPFA